MTPAVMLKLDSGRGKGEERWWVEVNDRNRNTYQQSVTIIQERRGWWCGPGNLN